MSDDETFQFVDTKVLIYAHDQSAGVKHVQAKQLLTALWQNRYGCVSIQVLQEFYVNVTQKVAKPLDSAVAAQIISDLSAWQVHQPGIEDILTAIRLQHENKISFWDAMIISSAISLGCGIVWSEDLNHNQKIDTVTIKNPFA
ncbi:MAG: PIN domain-containing protein [Blastocatellia bacterium]|nr:PIN domain-containing protein [Blastocatellia bacterium]